MRYLERRIGRCYSLYNSTRLPRLRRSLLSIYSENLGRQQTIYRSKGSKKLFLIIYKSSVLNVEFSFCLQVCQNLASCPLHRLERRGLNGVVKSSPSVMATNHDKRASRTTCCQLIDFGSASYLKVSDRKQKNQNIISMIFSCCIQLGKLRGRRK